MRKLCFHAIAIAGILSCAMHSVAGTQEDSIDCKFWNQLAANLSKAHEVSKSLRMDCNSSCNSIMCNGHIHQPVFLSGMDIDDDFCFGLHLNHCDNPVSMDYYIDIPTRNISMDGKVSHNNTYTVPGLKLPTAGDATILIVVEMVRVNSSFVLMSVDAKVRLMMGSYPFFPYSEKVFPETYIDIPPCTATSSKDSTFAHPTCSPKFEAPSTTGSPKSSTAAPTVQINSSAATTQAPGSVTATYNNSCEIGVGQCSINELCQIMGDPNLSRNGVCVCQPGASISHITGLCQSAGTSRATPSGAATTQAPSVTVLPSAVNATKATTGSHGKGMTTLIIGSVAGGLLLIVVIVATIIYIGRRRRQAIYRGRQQLLTDNIDDDDDDVNLVV